MRSAMLFNLNKALFSIAEGKFYPPAIVLHLSLELHSPSEQVVQHLSPEHTWPIDRAGIKTKPLTFTQC